MIHQAGISQIHTGTIGTYLGEERCPLFIAVLRRDPDLAANLENLKEVAAEFKKDRLIVCYTLEELLPYFTIRFKVGGTPTFLMIISGIVLGTLLGKNTAPALVKFVHGHLNESRIHQKARVLGQGDKHTRPSRKRKTENK